MRIRPRKEVKIFQLLVTDYLQLAEQQTQNCYGINQKMFKT